MADDGIIEKILRPVSTDNVPPGHLLPDFIFWCPGCKCGHGLWVTRKNSRGAQWTWDGDQEKPTFTPSLLMDTTKSRCHLFVRNGMLEFLSDCEHELAGKTVPMEPF
jgi:hypothetical protein